MASGTSTVKTVSLTGTLITALSSIANAETVSIAATTAQSALDFSSLFIRVENVNTITSVALSLAAGTEFSGIGVGAKSITIGTASTVIIGGQDFESCRFLNSSGTIVFTQSGTGPTNWESYQYPRVTE